MKNRLILGRKVKLGIRILIPLALLVGLLLPAPVQAAPGTLNLLGVAWDHYDITVKINYNKSIAQAVILEVGGAVDDWNAAIDTAIDPQEDSLTVFNLTTVNKGKADIVISLRKGSPAVTGVIGQTILNINKDGSIRSVHILISGAALGNDFSATMVGNIVRHELGHALGLGHADVSGDLMYPYLLTPETEIPISSLDILAFATAHDWHPGSFEPPTETSVSE